MANVNQGSAPRNKHRRLRLRPVYLVRGVDKMGRTLGDGLDWSGLPPGMKGPVVVAMAGPSRPRWPIRVRQARVLRGLGYGPSVPAGESS